MTSIPSAIGLTMIAGYWLSMLGMVVNAYLHFNPMEPYLTPERETLLRLMEVAGIEIVENASMCRERNNQFAGFTLSTPSTEYIEVIICTDAILEHMSGVRGALEINRTVDHEALHAAQFCKNDYYPGSVSDDMTTDNELEAQSYEDRPQAVGEKLIQFCF